MSKRGPKPQPAEEKLAKGNPGKRAVRDPVVVAGKGAPRMPRGLSKRAQTIWREHVDPLVKAGILDRIDGRAFGAYCRWRALAEEMGERVAKVDDIVIENSNDTKSLHPLWKAHTDASNMADKLGSRFGLDPSSRTQLTGSARTAGADPATVDSVGQSPRLRGIDGGRGSTAG